MIIFFAPDVTIYSGEVAIGEAFANSWNARSSLRCLNPRGLQLDIIQHHWRENHAWDPHQFFTKDQPQQRQPEWIADSVANNFSIQEVFKFVDDDQEKQTDDG